MVSPVNVIASPSQFASGVPFKQKAAQGITWIDQNDPSTGAARPDRSSTPNRATFLRSWRSGRDRLRLSGTVWPYRALSHFGCDDRGAGDCSMQSTRFSHYGRISSHLHGDDHEHHNLHGRHKFDSHYQRSVSAAAGVTFPSCPLKFWAGDQHDVIDSTRDLSGSMRRHRDRRREQCVLQRHNHQQRPSGNIDYDRHR